MRDHPRPHPEARELDECVQAAWLDFLARELRLADPRLEGRRPSDLRAVHIADGFFRTAFDDGGPVDLDDVVRHARAIFDNPLRTLYPILFPRDKPRRAGEGGATYRFEDLSYGVRIRDRQREVFICNQFDIELLSAALDSHGEVNPWSIKALSLRPHEFLYLAPDDQANVRTIFNSRFFLQATELREAHLDPELPPPVTHGLRKLAAFPLFLANVSTNGCGPQGLLDFVPDLAYQAC